MVYVDDIGIMAKCDKEKLKELCSKINDLSKLDPNQELHLHPLGEKSKIISHEEGLHILGLELKRNKIAISSKTKAKIIRTKKKLNKSMPYAERQKIKHKHSSLLSYKRYAEH